MVQVLKKHLTIANGQISKAFATKNRNGDIEVEPAKKRDTLGIGPFKPGDVTKNQPTKDCLLW